jgi:hypothetical protein
MSNTDIGAKVFVKQRGQWLYGLVIGSAPSTSHAHMQVRLRVAVQNPLVPDQWIVNDLPTPVQVKHLRFRENPIEALDAGIPALLAQREQKG